MLAITRNSDANLVSWRVPVWVGKAVSAYCGIQEDETGNAGGRKRGMREDGM